MKKKFKIRFDEGRNGVTIWVNGRWVMDASLFGKEMELSIDRDRMKEVKNYKHPNHLRLRYDRRTT